MCLEAFAGAAGGSKEVSGSLCLPPGIGAVGWYFTFVGVCQAPFVYLQPLVCVVGVGHIRPFFPSRFLPCSALQMPVRPGTGTETFPVPTGEFLIAR